MALVSEKEVATLMERGQEMFAVPVTVVVAANVRLKVPVPEIEAPFPIEAMFLIVKELVPRSGYLASPVGIATA